MKVLLSLGLVAMLGLSTQLMAASTDMLKRNDRVQIAKVTTIKSDTAMQSVQRTDRIQFKTLVATEINKFSQRQDFIREKRNDRVTITRRASS